MDRLHGKRIGLIVAVVASATVTWAAARIWLLHADRFTNWSLWFLPAGSLILLGAVTGLAWMLIPGKHERLAAILGSWATFIFFWPPNIYYLSVLPLFLLLWWEAANRIRSEVTERKRLKVNAILGRSVKLIIMGALLLVSLGYFISPKTQDADVNSISGEIQEQIGNVYDNPIVENQFSDLPPSAQAQVRQNVAAQVDQWIRQYLGPLREYIPPLLAFGFFLTLWSLTFIFREGSIWLGVAMFHLLKAMGFVKIEEVEEKIETVSL
jgi:hypothetical protein